MLKKIVDVFNDIVKLGNLFFKPLGEGNYDLTLILPWWTN